MKIDRDMLINGLIPVFYSFFGGKKKIAGMLDKVYVILSAYDDIRALRTKFIDAASRGESLLLNPDEVRQGSVALIAIGDALAFFKSKLDR